MTVYKSRRCIGLPLGLVLLLEPAAVGGLTHEAKTLDRTIDPVTIGGEYFTNLLGTDIRRLRLFSFRRGSRIPIPFQMDQQDSKGDWVWDIAYTEGWPPSDSAFNEAWSPAWERSEAYVGVQDDEDPPGKQLLDGNDVLVFMARDLGDRNLAAQEALFLRSGHSGQNTHRSRAYCAAWG